MRLGSGRGPPPLGARNDPQLEQPTTTLASDFNDNTAPSQDAPSEAALSIVDHDRFDVLVEAANLAIHHAKRARHAALMRDRLRSRLHACAASRSVRTMLLTVEELCRERAK
jgi:hypothetical protein